MKLTSVEEMKNLERHSSLPVPDLMENAGLGIAKAARRLLSEPHGRIALVLVGSGNNGGDGLVAARHLHDWGADVHAYLLKPRPDDDSLITALVERGVPLVLASKDLERGYNELENYLATATLVIDALLGTGTARPIKGQLAEVLRRLAAARERRSQLQLLAVDLPSGLDPDSGAADPLCVPADQTVALGLSKIGLHTLPGASHVGTVEVADIGIPNSITDLVTTELLTKEWAAGVLPPRPSAANKGTFGKALVVAGSPGYVGAAYLASSGATRVGAGLVTSACAGTVYPILAAKLIETTFVSLPDEDGQLSGEAAYAVGQALSGYDALLVGCGLGQSGYVRAFMRALLPTLNKESLIGSVIDADGLNNLTVSDSETGRRWWKELAVPTVITPHPGEMARLCGSSVQEIESNRLAAARTGAARWGTTVVLKGAHTVVAEPSGHARISPFANPGLASAGTGDVLAGATVGFIAQGMEPFDAASLAVFVHGLAGERVRSELGQAGMVASDLLPELPRVMKELLGA